MSPNAACVEVARSSPLPGAPALLDARAAYGGSDPTPHLPGTAAADDAHLLALLRMGDEAAFRLLVERHGRLLTRLARMYATEAVADEVVQETWIAVLRGLDRFEGRSSLRTWMSRILVNIARDHITREHRQVPFSAFEGPADDTGPAVDPDRFRPAGAQFAGGWTSFPERWDEQPEQRFSRPRASASPGGPSTRAAVQRAVVGCAMSRAGRPTRSPRHSGSRPATSECCCIAVNRGSAPCSRPRWASACRSGQ